LIVIVFIVFFEREESPEYGKIGPVSLVSAGFGPIFEDFS